MLKHQELQRSGWNTQKLSSQYHVCQWHSFLVKVTGLKLREKISETGREKSAAQSLSETSSHFPLQNGKNTRQSEAYEIMDYT